MSQAKGKIPFAWLLAVQKGREIMTHALLIKNARLETNYNTSSGRVISTATDYFDILVETGKIMQIAKEIIPSEKDTEIIDANGALMLPSLREMHIHIDKTYYGGEWQAVRPATNGIFTRFEEEKELLPKQLATVQERAEKVIELYLRHGHTHIRTHCNVDPYIGTKHIELTKQALAKYSDRITSEIVAFPQHGLLRSQVTGLMKEAMRMGADLVGGVDPSTVDGHIDHSFQTMMEIATEFDKGLDIHLHNPDTLGEYEFYKLAAYTEKANWQNRVTISHGIGLADLEGQALDEMIARLAEVGIDVTSTIPINRRTIPVEALYDGGVSVSVGHDSLTDHWSPFGTGDTIAKLNLLAERFKYLDEYSLSRTLRYATGGVTPLNEAGVQVWPQRGDRADFILVDAESTAHLIARKRHIHYLVAGGKVAYTNESPKRWEEV
ncbi:amidohydrolase [Listeria grayi]|uniref:Deaminase n=1 Tax=Listeria grayi DSM 20601 TaxID=525367 RepID=D7UWZ0_LISGR|nr:putative deaminase [Listeria grayi DSM 20601]